jgi:type IV secretory pathway TrbF-like protein
MRFLKQFVGDKNGTAQVNGNGKERIKPLFEPNPYLNARRQWNSNIDRAFASVHVWQLVAVACLLIALSCVAGIVYIGSKAKYVPFVIQVDRLGETVAVGPAHVAAPADPRVIRASLAAFVANARMVTPDTDLQRKAVFSAYAMLRGKDPATAKLSEYLNGTPDATPFARAAKMTVSVEVRAVSQITEFSWTVDWTETLRDRQGALIGVPMSMRAMIQIYVDPPAPDSNEAQISRNPLGIWVGDYTWSQL